jgi:predicted aspartyl protease
MPSYDGEFYSPAAPIARVTVRHPHSSEMVRNVCMLIDTGADATLLPRSVVASLALKGVDERYELVAFDGTVHEAEEIHAVLFFLNQTFRGRFLEIDSEFGILGRNVLNSVRLLLDGPALRWEELPPARDDA